METWMSLLCRDGSSGGQVSPSDTSYRTPGFPSSTQHPTGLKYSNIGSADLPETRGGGGGGAGGGGGPNQDGGITTAVHHQAVQDGVFLRNPHEVNWHLAIPHTG